MECGAEGDVGGSHAQVSGQAEAPLTLHGRGAARPDANRYASGGCVQKASGVAKSGAVSVSRCSFCVDEAAGEDGLGCCPASSTLPHTSSATAASAARCRLSAPLDNRGACSGGSLECEIVCRACVSTGGMLRIPFRRRAVPLL